MNKLNFIDLFSGAGGLSEGFKEAGFEPIAHVEINKDASDTVTTRSVYHYLKENGQFHLYEDYLHKRITREELWSSVPKKVIDACINKEISKNNLPFLFDKIDSLLDGKSVDLVIGGPPCQAYSIAGRARDPKGMTDDPRNHLYKHYVQFLKRYQPKMFVFENVPGILSAKNGEFLNKIFSAVKSAGYNLSIPPKKHLNSKNFNVLQDRKRVIIIGWQKDLGIEYPSFEEKGTEFTTENSIFKDLPKLQQGEGHLGVVNYAAKTTDYLRDTNIRNGLGYTTQHIARPHNETDLKIYKIAVDLIQKEGKRLNYADLPSELIKHKNVSSFTNRFQVVNPKGISHTVVAHIAMDGHYYIHPDQTQNRSISLREAARIQSFPDDFFFEGSRTAAFKQIGNAVPPLMARGIAKKIKGLL